MTGKNTVKCQLNKICKTRLVTDPQITHTLTHINTYIGLVAFIVISPLHAKYLR